jgi:hypothetical protein
VAVSQCEAFAVVQLVSERQHVGPGLGHALAELVLVDVDVPTVDVPVVVLVMTVVPPSASVVVTTVVPVVVVTDPVEVARELLVLVLPVAASGAPLRLGELPPQPCAITSAQPNAQGAITSHNACVFLFMQSSFEDRRPRRENAGKSLLAILRYRDRPPGSYRVEGWNRQRPASPPVPSLDIRIPTK